MKRPVKPTRLSGGMKGVGWLTEHMFLNKM
jgi:hypothetical protein